MSKNWKKLLGKKWAFPAVYMMAAALILALMWWYQDPNDYPLTKEDIGLEQEMNLTADSEPYSDSELAEKLGEVVSVTNTIEQMRWPVASADKVSVSLEFFDKDAGEQELENAIVSFENQFYPHTGIDIVANDNSEFTVQAALSGEVVRAEKDPVVGYVVEIKHDRDLTTIYSSLSDVKVSKGDRVEQGTEIASASKNMFEKDQGVHLHFEVRQSETVLNPYLFFDQDMNEVLDQLAE